MLHTVLRRSGSHAAHNEGHKTAAVTIDRMAKYMAWSSLAPIHHANEPNYRKEPLGWQAYCPENMDNHAAFPYCDPPRHLEKPISPGSWFGMAHWSIKRYGVFKWFVLSSWMQYIGVFLGLWLYFGRMRWNGWQIKNRGAIRGYD